MTTAVVRSARRRIRHAPCTFIQYIDKEYDVRAVAVGSRIFAVRIDSQASPLESARMDWRDYDDAHVRWERMDLPKALERSMLRLMKTLDLKWGVFDLVKGKDGAFYFLEVNRPGSCSELQALVGLDINQEIVSYLRRLLS